MEDPGNIGLAKTELVLDNDVYERNRVRIGKLLQNTRRTTLAE
jgi:hypothetical protein